MMKRESPCLSYFTHHVLSFYHSTEGKVGQAKTKDGKWSELGFTGLGDFQDTSVKESLGAVPFGTVNANISLRTFISVSATQTVGLSQHTVFIVRN